MSRSFSELAERYSQLLGARASWFLPAAHVPEAMAKLGLVGPSDVLVACADDFEQAIRACFPGTPVRFVGEPAADAFLEASGMGTRAEEGGPTSEPAHHASYAHAAGAQGARLFWFVNSIGCRGLRVPDLRLLGRAAQTAGAILVVDNTVASHIGCHPLALGAHICLEALDRVCEGRAPRKLVALSVARSVVGRGRRQRTDPLAEEAYLLLAMRLGQGAAPAGGLTADEIGCIDHGLYTFAIRMQLHMDGARVLAEYLAAHPAVPEVAYPGLKGHPDRAHAGNVLEHGFGPAIDLRLPAPVRAQSLISVVAPSFRSAPAGGALTRVSALEGPDGSLVRIFVGREDPLELVDSFERALSMLGGA